MNVIGSGATLVRTGAIPKDTESGQVKHPEGHIGSMPCNATKNFFTTPEKQQLVTCLQPHPSTGPQNTPLRKFLGTSDLLPLYKTPEAKCPPPNSNSNRTLLQAVTSPACPACPVQPERMQQHLSSTKTPKIPVSDGQQQHARMGYLADRQSLADLRRRAQSTANAYH